MIYNQFIVYVYIYLQCVPETGGGGLPGTALAFGGYVN